MTTDIKRLRELLEMEPGPTTGDEREMLRALPALLDELERLREVEADMRRLDDLMDGV